MLKGQRAIPESELLAALEAAWWGLDNPGFCLACGKQQDGCEPDARNYECERCGAWQVFGAQEILLMGAYR